MLVLTDIKQVSEVFKKSFECQSPSRLYDTDKIQYLIWIRDGSNMIQFN